EHTLALLLSVARRVPQSQSHLRAGGWRGSVSYGPELSGSTVGILGLGNVGRAVARMLAGFGVRLLAHDPLVSPAQAREVGAELVELEALFAESDFLSVHCALTPETYHLVNAERLARMKPTAILVNCARGPVVDEKALCQTLREGRLGGAGLDVFEQEPPSPENPLLGLPNVVCTPHLGGSSAKARERVYRITGENVVRVLRGQKPREECLLNPEVF
ncbi:MAG: NAD(P)-dependent oxidoreductase, partial [Nitrospinota bacterium]